MTTFYSETDMISFGTYLLSMEREESLYAKFVQLDNSVSYADRSRLVYDIDFENWLAKQDV